MIQHLITLIWNRKRANFLLISEIFLAFLVLFVVGSTLVYNGRNYQAPLGFDYAQVWNVDLDNGSSPQTNAQIVATERQILQRLQALPGVQSAALSDSNTPFSNNHSSTSLARQPNGPGPNADIYHVSEAMPAVLQLPLRAGRWFDKRDEASPREVVVLSEEAEQALFPGQSAVGQRVYSNAHEWQIVGVTGPYRADGNLSEPKPAYFVFANPQDTTLSKLTHVLVRVQPGAGAALEKRMSTEIMALGKGWTSSITPLPEERATQLQVGLAPLVALLLVCLFLVVNVSLGLFGVLWQTINQRRGEIGLRRAFGASAGAISGQILVEILVVTTFGLGLGLVVAAQFPLLAVLGVPAGVYVMAMLGAAGVLYLLTIACALYPSQLAAGIQPAVALREE